MPKYIVNGQDFIIPDSLVTDFERENPGAAEVFNAGGKQMAVPLGKRDKFAKRHPNAVPFGNEPPAPQPSGNGKVTVGDVQQQLAEQARKQAEETFRQQRQARQQQPQTPEPQVQPQQGEPAPAPAPQTGGVTPQQEQGTGNKATGAAILGAVKQGGAEKPADQKSVEEILAEPAPASGGWKPTRQQQLALGMMQPSFDSNDFQKRSQEAIGNMSLGGSGEAGFGYDKNIRKGAPSFNAETGQFEDTWLTSDGQRFNNKMQANNAQQYLDYNMDMTRYRKNLEGLGLDPEDYENSQNIVKLSQEMQELMNERDNIEHPEPRGTNLYQAGLGAPIHHKELTDEEKQRIADIDKRLEELRNERLPLINAQLESAQVERDRLIAALDKEKKKSVTPLFSKGRYITDDARGISNPQLTLESAISNVDDRIRMLEAARDENGQSMFWRGVSDVATNPNTWTFGISDFINFAEIAKIQQKEANGETLNDKEKALLSNSLMNQSAQQLGQFMPKSYGYGTSGMSSVPFMAEFLLTGGFGGVAKAGVRWGAKKGLQWAKSGLAEKLSKNFGGKVLVKTVQSAIKGSGRIGGAMAGGALQSTTVGLPKTAADIINRHTGDMTLDDFGRLSFKDQESWAKASLNGMLANTFENGSELMGPGFDFAQAYLGRVIRKTAAGQLMNRLARNKYWKKGNKALEAFGINGFLGEGLEEEYNMFSNALARTGETNWFKDPNDPNKPAFFDSETQLDTWVSVGLTGALLRAPQIVAQGYQGAQYYGNKYNLNRSDQRMKSVFSPDRYMAVRDLLDNADNKNLGKVMNNLLNNAQLTNDEREAVVFYAQDLVNLRGFNIGSVVAAANGVKSQPRVSSYNVRGNTVEEVDADGNVLATHEYENADEMKAGLYKMQQDRFDSDLRSDIDVMKTRPDNQYAQVLSDYCAEAGIDAAELEKALAKPSMERSDQEQAMILPFAKLIHNTVYDNTMLHEEQSAEDGERIADESSIDLENPQVPEDIEADWQAAQQNRQQAFDKNEELMEEVTRMENEGMSHQEIVSALDSFRPEEVQAVIDYYNQKARKEAYMNRVNNKINEEAANSRERHKFKGTINGNADVNNVYTITDGVNKYYLVSGNVNTDSEGHITGSASGLIIGLDSNGEFVSIGDTEGYSVMPATQTLDQFEEGERARLQELWSKAIDGPKEGDTFMFEGDQWYVVNTVDGLMMTKADGTMRPLDEEAYYAGRNQQQSPTPTLPEGEGGTQPGAQDGGEAGGTNTGANEPSAAAPSYTEGQTFEIVDDNGERRLATVKRVNGENVTLDVEGLGEMATKASSVDEYRSRANGNMQQQPSGEAQGTAATIESVTDDDGVKRYEQGVAVDDAIADIEADGLDVNEEADLAISEAQAELNKMKAPKTRAERVKNAARTKELQQTIDYYNNVKQRYNELHPVYADAAPFVERLNKATSKKMADDILNEAIQAGVNPTEIQPVHTQRVSDLITQAEEARRQADEVTDADKRNIMQNGGTPEGRAALLDKKKGSAEKRRKLAKLIYGDYFDDDFERVDSIEELISKWLSKGRTLDPDTFGKELGWDMGVGGDASKVSTMFTAKRENGGDGMTFNEFVHMVWESSENTLPNGEKRFDDRDIRNALINMFQSAQSKSELTELMLNNRIAAAEQAVENDMRRAEEENRKQEQDAEQEPQETGEIETNAPIQGGMLPFPPQTGEPPFGQEQAGQAEVQEPVQNEQEAPTVETPTQETEETAESTEAAQETILQSQSREDYIASHPLTEEQIMADTEATEDEKLNAIDFLKGEDESAISRFYYDQIYNRVKQKAAAEQESVEKDSTFNEKQKAYVKLIENMSLEMLEQLAKRKEDAVNGDLTKLADDPEYSAIKNLIVQREYERLRNEIKYFIANTIDDNDVTFVDKLTPTELDKLDSLIDEYGVDDSEGKIEDYVKKLRKKYPVEEKKEKTAKEQKPIETENPIEAIEQAAESFKQEQEKEQETIEKRKERWQGKREEQKSQDQQDIDDALKEFSDFLDSAKGSGILGKFMRKGLEGNDKAQASLLDALLLGTNAAQRAFVGDLLRLASKVGYAYIKSGVHDVQAWSKQMADSIGRKLKEVLGWDDSLVDEFVGEVWEQKYTVDGERMRLREHAEKLKNNKESSEYENKDVNLQPNSKGYEREIRKGLPEEGEGIGREDDAASNILQGCRIEPNENGQGRRPKERLLDELEKSARGSSAWIDDISPLVSGEIGTGGENEVYQSKDGNYAIKLNDFEYLDDNATNFDDVINRIKSQGELFPDVPLKIIGFAKNSKGKVCVVLQQPYIENAREATEQEIEDLLEQMGFYEDRTGAMTEDSGRFAISDVKPNNVLVDKDGNLHFVDVITYDEQLPGKMMKPKKLKNNKGADQTVNVNKDISQSENKDVTSQKEAEQGPQPAENLEGDSAEFAERQKKIDILTQSINHALKEAIFQEKVTLKTMQNVKAIAEKLGLFNMSMTDLQELVEAEVVNIAREIANDNQYKSEEQKFEYIVKLYQNQPTLSARDNDRINKQQYSTPAPMAFLMGLFTGKGKKVKKVLEPSAGNGMLTIALPKESTHVNDIDEMRLSNLEKQGFGQVTSQDGLQPFEQKAYDVVVTNPPFGSVTPKVYDGIYEISGLEHQMAINALESMKDDGRAAIIIGGNTEYKTNGAVQGKDRVFLNYLYSHYNVVDVINMDGKSLYTKQGTGYPVRMILIDGRKPFDKDSFAPVKSKARAEQVKSYDELYKRVNDDILSDRNKPAGVHDTESGESRGVDDTSNAGNTTQTGVRNVRAGGSSGEHPVLDESRRGVSGSDNSAEERADTQGHRGLGGEPSMGDGGRTEPTQPSGSTTSQADGGRGISERRDNAERPDGGNDVSVGGRPRPSVEVRRLGTEKVPYRQQSSNPYSLQSQMPAEQADVVKKALEELGDVDQFLVKELGYSSVEDLHHGSQSPENHGGLAAEQVDSVAMAIHQMNQGNAFIIGDQTGIGKGRQAAALIRYGVKKGGNPVFVTVKKGLFSDMYRDLCDIGSPDLKPFIWSADDNEHSANVTDKDGNVVYKLPTAKEQKRVMDYILKNGKLPPEYDYIVTTYDSFKGGTMDYENGQKKARNFGKKSPTSGAYNSQAKRDALEALAANSYVIMDESHNAGGETSAVSGYLQYITTRAKGVTFLSATFAKRPGNMPIYSLKTAIAKAGVEVRELIDAVKRGGATFQEIMSKALTEAGQMIRRERDMSGVTIDWRGIEDESVVQQQREQYDKIIGLFNDIINFQRTYVDPIVDKLNDDAADAQGVVEHTPGTRDMGINNTPFASRTYNIVQQVLLSLKAEETAKRAIEHLKMGRKPVIALANTNEGAADDVAAADGESMVMPDLSVNLKKGLRGTLRITKKDAFGNSTNSEIPFERLSPEGQARYAEIMDAIENASTGLSLSPIDVIKNELKKAGYKVGELTGRQAEFTYNEDGTVKRVKRQITDKKKIAADFNNGKLDALILNQSAGTGISLHASTKFKDQSQRVMIVAQAQGDVNNEVQIRGRIDRTGQVHRGMYEYVVSQIPSEQRLLMMLKAKLRSLDANTTSSQKSKFNEMQVQDIINKYGDDIVIAYLAENTELAEKMQNPLKWKGDWQVMPFEQLVSEAEKGQEAGGTASKVLGRMALLTVKEQEKMLSEIGELYQAEIDRLNEMGENDLEITEMPLKAKTLSKDVWEQGIEPGGKNPFADNTYVEKVNMDVLKKPMKGEEVRKSQERLLGGKTWDEYKQATMEKVDKWADDKKAETTKTITERAEKKAKAEQERYVKGAKKAQDKNGMTDEEIEKNGKFQYDTIYKQEMEKLDAALDGIEAQKQVFVDALEMFNTDDVYALPSNIYDLGSMTFEPSFGKLIDVKISDNFSTNASTLTFATLDGRRKITVPINGKVKQQNGEKRELFPVINTLTAQTRHGMFGSNVANTLKVLGQNIDNWDRLTSSAARKDGYIITGNLLKALVSTREQGVGGKLISYTTDTGEVRQGILMPDNFDPARVTSKTPISSKKDELKYKGDSVTSADGDVTIKVTGRWDWSDRGYNTMELTVPKSKKKGDKYFNDEKLLSLMDGHQFEGSSKLKAEFPREKLDDVMKRLDELGVVVTEEKKQSDTSSTNSNRRFDEDIEESVQTTKKNGKPASNQKSRIAKHIDNLVKKLGTKARTTVYHSLSELPEDMRKYIENAHRRGKKVRGWYENGQIYLYLPDIDSEYEAEKTIWHETVAHHGLRQLIGEENYNKLLRQLWLEHRDGDMGEWVTRRMELNGWSLSEAIDEYLAREAEEEPFKDPSLWQRLQWMLSEILHKMGFATDPTISDVKYLFWLSQNQLREGDPISKIKQQAFLHNLERQAENTPYVNMNATKAEDIYNPEAEGAYDDGVRHSEETDEEVIERLEKEPKIKTYRAMMLIDGKLYPPMATFDSDSKQLPKPIELGKWERADERPEKAIAKKNKKGETSYYFRLQKSPKSGDYVDARYDPYIHTSTTMLNDQFKAAEQRPGLVVVEMEVPESELTSGYKAEKAYLPVGKIPWTAGAIQKQLTGTRDVILSRWAKPVRIVPTEEYAKHVANLVKGQVEVFPSAIVTPEQRKALEKEGIKFVKTNGKLVIQEGEHKGEQYEKVYARPKSAERGGRRFDEDIDNPMDYSAKAVYDDRLNRVETVFTEAYQDAMVSLKTAQNAIAGDEEIPDSQNAYQAENLMHGKNKNEQDLYNRMFRDPLIATINKIMNLTGMNWGDVDRYVFTKSGLERNRELFVRDNADEAKKADWNDLKDSLFADLQMERITFPEYLAGLDNFIRSNVDSSYVPSEHDYSGFREMYGDKDGNYDEADIIDELMNTEDAINSLDNGVYESTTDTLWGQINDATRYGLERYREAGMRSDEQIDNVERMFHFYVPMRGFKKDMAEDVYQYFTSPDRTPGSLGNLLKRAKGRGSEAEFPIATIFAMSYKAIADCNQNLVNQKLYRLCQAHPNDLIVLSDSWAVLDNATGTWQESTPNIPDDATEEEVRQITLAWEEDMQNLAKQGLAKKITGKGKLDYRPINKKNQSEHIVNVRINGQPKKMIVTGNPRMAQALNGQLRFEKGKNPFSRFNSWAKNKMAAMFTSYSPTFALRNMFRDWTHFRTMLGVKEGHGYAQAANKYYRKSLFKMVGLFKKYREGTLDMNKEIERDFKDFMDNGGVTGYVQMSRVESIQKELEKLYKQQKNGKPVRINNKIWDYTLGAVEAFNEAIENNARFATFRASRHYAGRTKARSAYDAKEITVNFNKKGAGAKTAGFKSDKKAVELAAKTFGVTSQVLGEGRIFFNATVQAIATTFKNFQNPDGSLNKEYIAKWALKYALPPFMFGFLLPMINKALAAALGGDDDDPYANLPEWTRRNNICIYIGNDNFITIPVGQELAAFLSLGDMVAGNTYAPEIKPVDRSAADEILSIMSTFSPVDVGTKITKGGIMEDPISEVVGRTFSVLAPLVAVEQNLGWTGRPIYREDKFQGDEYTPEYQMVYNGTNPVLANASKLLHELGGGDDVKRGNLEVNPGIIQYLWEQYTGGPGKVLGNTISIGKDVKDILSGEEGDFNIRKIEGAKAFVQQGDDRTQFYRTNAKYNKYKKDADELYHDINGYKAKAAEDPTAILKINEIPREDIVRMEIVREADKNLSQINRAANKAEGSQRKELRRIYNELVQEVVRLLDNVGELVEQQ